MTYQSIPYPALRIYRCMLTATVVGLLNSIKPVNLLVDLVKSNKIATQPERLSTIYHNIRFLAEQGLVVCHGELAKDVSNYEVLKIPQDNNLFVIRTAQEIGQQELDIFDQFFGKNADYTRLLGVFIIFSQTHDPNKFAGEWGLNQSLQDALRIKLEGARQFFTSLNNSYLPVNSASTLSFSSTTRRLQTIPAIVVSPPAIRQPQKGPTISVPSSATSQLQLIPATRVLPTATGQPQLGPEMTVFPSVTRQPQTMPASMASPPATSQLQLVPATRVPSPAMGQPQLRPATGGLPPAMGQLQLRPAMGVLPPAMGQLQLRPATGVLPPAMGQPQLRPAMTVLPSVTRQPQTMPTSMASSPATSQAQTMPAIIVSLPATRQSQIGSTTGSTKKRRARTKATAAVDKSRSVSDSKMKAPKSRPSKRIRQEKELASTDDVADLASKQLSFGNLVEQSTNQPVAAVAKVLPENKPSGAVNINTKRALANRNIALGKFDIWLPIERSYMPPDRFREMIVKLTQVANDYGCILNSQQITVNSDYRPTLFQSAVAKSTASATDDKQASPSQDNVNSL